MKKYLFPLALVTMTAIAALPGQAAVINTVSEDDFVGNGGTNVTLSSFNNLVLASTLSTTGWTAAHPECSIAVLKDGSLGSSGGPKSDQAALSSSNPWTLTIALNNAISLGGYTISGINLISGWNSDDVNMNYTVSYSTVSDPGTFTSLGTYKADSTLVTTNVDAYKAITLKSALTADSGVLAADVASIRFVFNTEAATSVGTSHGLGSTAYREIEVIGVQSVPEPSTWAMLVGGMGMLAFGQQMRRRSA